MVTDGAAEMPPLKHLNSSDRGDDTLSEDDTLGEDDMLLTEENNMGEGNMMSEDMITGVNSPDSIIQDIGFVTADRKLECDGRQITTIEEEDDNDLSPLTEEGDGDDRFRQVFGADGLEFLDLCLSTPAEGIQEDFFSWQDV